MTRRPTSTNIIHKRFNLSFPYVQEVLRGLWLDVSHRPGDRSIDTESLVVG